MLKRLIVHILKKFNIGIYRLHKVKVNSQIGPLERNSLDYKERQITFSGVKDYLDLSRLDFYNKILDFCIENGVNFNNSDIVDVGCSGGWLLEMIGKNYSPISITGYDWSKKTIEFAKKLSPLPSYVQFDILKNEIKKKFDIVICTEVLEHLLYPEKAINNLLLMTRKGGFICISVPDGRKDTSYEHINFWSPESFRLFIEKSVTIADSKYGILNDSYNPNCSYNIVILKKK